MVGAWDKLHGYTSNADGIHHALLDEDSLDQADARYVLVTCSAFVSHLIHLAGKHGIPLDK